MLEEKNIDPQSIILAYLFIKKEYKLAKFLYNRNDLLKLYIDTRDNWMPMEIIMNKSLQRSFSSILYALAYHYKFLRVYRGNYIIWNF